MVKNFSGFVNALLKNILDNLDEVSKTKIDLYDFPNWFIKQVNNKKKFKTDKFIEAFCTHTQVYI